MNSTRTHLSALPPRAACATLGVIAMAGMGCSPQNATVTEGSYQVFLSQQTSPVFADAEEALEFGSSAKAAFNVDCADDEDERVPDALDICGDDAWPPEHEGWLQRDAFRVVEEDIEPWRGEAIITWEGHLQLTFHHRAPDGEDLRFTFTVDPEFQPTVCQVDDQGKTVAEPLDGDWVDAWSQDLGSDEEGTLYYLNSGAYQFNPHDMNEIWVLPTEWRAGSARAKFGGEDFIMRSVRYGLPSAYTEFETDEMQEPSPSDLFHVTVPEGQDPLEHSGFLGLIDTVDQVAAEIEQEMDLVGREFRPRVHTNAWRQPNGSAIGLDSWVELHYNWVRFDQPRDQLADGESISGDFHLMFDGDQSQSRILLEGAFEADVHADRWVVDDITEVKLEEYGTTLCGDDDQTGGDPELEE